MARYFSEHDLLETYYCRQDMRIAYDLDDLEEYIRFVPTADVVPKSEAVSEMDYMSSAIEKIIIERNKTVDSAILGEIQKIAVENGIEAKIVLNEKNVADALRNYQDGYAAIKREVAREIKAFEKKVGQIYNHYVFEDADYADDDVAIEAVINALTEVLNELAELEKKYTEGGEQ